MRTSSRRLAAGTALLILTTATAAVPTPPSAVEARAALASVDSLLALDLAAQAVDEAAAALARHGGDPLYGDQFAGRLGLALLRDGRVQEALPHLETAVRQAPEVSVHHRNLGQALLQMGRRGRALSEFSLAVELDPSDPAARLAHGQLLVAYRDFGRAESELETARLLCDGCADADRALALLHTASGNWPAARGPLQRLHALGDDPAVRRNLLAALDAMRDDEALAALLAEREQAAWSADEWRYAARLEGRLGGQAPRSRAALAAAGDPAVDVPRSDAGYWGQVSLNLLAAGDPEAALAAADRAVALAPDSAVHHNNRAVLLQRLGRDEAARAAAARARELEAARGGGP
jgi:Flp pilus assembly protein TadD